MDHGDCEPLVGAEGFEPPTLCSQSRCATRLRYAPTVVSVDCSVNFALRAGARSPAGPVKEKA